MEIEFANEHGEKTVAVDARFKNVEDGTLFALRDDDGKAIDISKGLYIRAGIGVYCNAVNVISGHPVYIGKDVKVSIYMGKLLLDQNSFCNQFTEFVEDDNAVPIIKLKKKG